MQLISRGNKAAVHQQLRAYILSHCDDDIAQTFAPHGFTMEPLLLQLVREFKLMRMGEGDRDTYLREVEARFHALTGSYGRPGGPGATIDPEGPGDYGAEGEPGTTPDDIEPRT